MTGEVEMVDYIKQNFVHLNGESIQEEFKIIEHVLKDLDYKVYVAGGYPRYIMSEKLVNDGYGDIDMYLYNQEDYEFVLEKLDGKYNRTGRTLGTISFFLPTENGDAEIQLINPDSYYHEQTWGHPYLVLNNYDFTISMIAYLGKGDIVKYQWWDRHMFQRKLVLWHTSHPVITANRILKYIQKGYTITHIELSELQNQWKSFEWGVYLVKTRERFLRVMEEIQ